MRVVCPKTHFGQWPKSALDANRVEKLADKGETNWFVKGRQLQPGDWLVLMPDGNMIVLKDPEFDHLYEAVEENKTERKDNDA
jgi:hypothetical protein